MLRLDPEDFEPIHAGDQLITEDMEFVSDRRLSELFQNNDTRKYIAPTGMFQVHTIPFKPIESNIPFIRGLPDSTRIYSDLKHANSRCVGLLSCSSRFTMPEGGTLTNVVRLNVFGDDPSSFRKHLIRHLMDITEISEDIFVLDITLPNEYKLDEIGKVLKDYGVEVEEWRINTASSSRVHLMEWGKF